MGWHKEFIQIIKRLTGFLKRFIMQPLKINLQIEFKKNAKN